MLFVFADEGFSTKLKDEWWGSKCCLDVSFSPSSSPVRPPTSESMCSLPDVLVPAAVGGYHCFGSGGSVTGIDSNAGGTSALCTERYPSGVWGAYTCLQAEKYWQTLEGKGKLM